MLQETEAKRTAAKAKRGQKRLAQAGDTQAEDLASITAPAVAQSAPPPPSIDPTLLISQAPARTQGGAVQQQIDSPTLADIEHPAALQKYEQDCPNNVHTGPTASFGNTGKWPRNLSVSYTRGELRAITENGKKQPNLYGGQYKHPSKGEPRRDLDYLIKEGWEGLSTEDKKPY